ncbi:hypothetical protein DSO57_1034766 [Entomophthora muscae]|uniref:Uncharacterized protein n=1 Tax=Entomophthora muscae TaxID=34485 RepID=A0ACC2T0M8_9FUNG|nr:hypothetical protein DSO57_1034766 [Entomophthora muscae]
MKQMDCEEWRPHLCSFPTSLVKLRRRRTTPPIQTAPPQTPLPPFPPRMYTRDSKWNPYHPNRFVSLEDEDLLEIEDHYLCLPDLDKYLPFKDNPRYNFVTVESIPKSPCTNSFSSLPSDTPFLEASPATSAAWGHRATGQEGKNKDPMAFQKPPLQPPWPNRPCNGIPGKFP